MESSVAAASNLAYDPEHYELFKNQPPPPPKFRDVFELRAATEDVLRGAFGMEPYKEEVTETKTEIATPDGGKISVSRFATAEHRGAPAEGEALRPAVLYIHGGGMVSCSVEIYAPAVARIVAAAGVQMFAVDYRLAPEHPAPTGVTDCWTALQWLGAHAREMHLDPARLAVAGDSAGGGLATGTALLARDRGFSPPLAKQILIYPMLDDRTHYPEDWPLLPFMLWRPGDNVLAWNATLGEDKRGKPDADISPYAVPGRATRLEGLPSTYIDVGSLDLFLNEDLAYVAKLAQANVQVEFHLYPGVPHGFDVVFLTQVAKSALANRVRAIQSF